MSGPGGRSIGALAEVRARVEGRPTALVLGGGGTLGSFETGALRFLYDQVGLVPSVVCGSSVGSLIAAKLAQGDVAAGDADGSEEAVAELEQLWRGLRENHDMWLPEPWFEALLTQGAWASELRHVAAIGGAHHHLPVHVIDTIVRHGHDVRATIDALRQALDATSLLNLHPVKSLLGAQLEPQRVAASGITLRMATVSLESGELRYVTETGSMVDRDNQPLDLEPVPLVDAVLASCSIPLVFPPVRLGSEHYVDGGTREALPVEMATNCLGGGGPTFAVAALPLEIAPAESFEHKGMVDIWRRVTGTIGPAETLRKDVDPPGGWGADVTVIVPQLRVHNALVVDPELIGISIDYGFMRAADVVLGADEETCAVTAEITRARMALRETAGGPVPGPFGPPSPAQRLDQPSRSPGELQERLRALVLRRREQGLPLPGR